MVLSLRLVVNGLSCQHVEFSGFGLKWIIIIIMTQPSENVLVKAEAVLCVCVCVYVVVWSLCGNYD